jgi:presenilin 1
VTCTVAVLSGLSITIILLAVNRKALPALPISITFGILFYLVSAIVLQPFVNSLTLFPTKQLGSNGFWLGKTPGATTLFV